MTRRTYVEARDSHTDTSDPEACWIWGGRLNEWGYGRSHRGQVAHRRAYIHEHGGIPEGLQIDHLCRNRACVNPAHLDRDWLRDRADELDPR